LPREEHAVFVVAADAGGVEGAGEVDDAEGVGPFGDEVAREDDVVFFGVVPGFVEECDDWRLVR
jgi:hypothetical protein